MESIYHIANQSDWEEAQKIGKYWPESRTQDGFLHLSPSSQLSWVGQSFYKGKSGLVLLEVAPHQVKEKLQWDFVEERNTSFPHLYGPLNLDAVIQVTPFFVS